MSKISVIIPVYNVEKYLRQSLDSVVNQTLKDIEIICVDDGSTDSSSEILQEYAQKDDRIKIIHQKNQGAGAARNNGLKESCADYVIFFDSDDYMNSSCLEVLYKTALTNNSDVTICRSFQLEEDNIETLDEIKYSIKTEFLNSKHCFSPREVSKYIFQIFVGWPWDKLYKREFILKNRLEFQNLRHSNDTYFVLMSLACAELISYTDEKLEYHRYHHNSLADTRTKAPLCFYYALREMKQELKHRGLYKIYEQSFVNYCVTFPRWHIDTITDKKTKKIMTKAHNKLLAEIKFRTFKKSYYYDRNAYNKTLETYQKFYIRNIGIHKVVCIFGIKINFKMQKLIERERFRVLNAKLDNLLKETVELKKLMEREVTFGK